MSTFIEIFNILQDTGTPTAPSSSANQDSSVTTRHKVYGCLDQTTSEDLPKIWSRIKELHAEDWIFLSDHDLSRLVLDRLPLFKEVWKEGQSRLEQYYQSKIDDPARTQGQREDIESIHAQLQQRGVMLTTKEHMQNLADAVTFDRDRLARLEVKLRASHVEHLEQENAKMAMAEGELRNKFEEERRANGDLREGKQRVEMENAKLTKERDELRLEVIELQGAKAEVQKSGLENSRLVVETVAIRGQLDASLAEVAGLRSRYGRMESLKLEHASLTAENQRLVREMGDMKEEKYNLRGESERLTRRIDELKAGQERADLAKEEMAKERDNLRRELEATKQAHECFQATTKSMERDFVVLKAETEKLMMESSQFRASTEASRKKIDELRAGKERADETSVKVVGERDRLRAELEGMRQSNSNLQINADRTKKEVADLNAAIERLRQANGTLTTEASRCVAMQNEIEELKEEQKREVMEKAAMEMLRGALQAQLETLRGQYGELKTEAERSGEDNIAFGTEMEKLRERNELLKGESAALMESEGRMMLENERVKAEIQKLETEHEKVVGARNDLQRKFGDIQTQNEGLQVRSKDLLEEMGGLRAECSRRTQEEDRLKAENVRVGRERDDFAATNEETQKTIGTLKVDNQRLEQENESTKKDCQRLYSTARDSREALTSMEAERKEILEEVVLLRKRKSQRRELMQGLEGRDPFVFTFCAVSHMSSTAASSSHQSSAPGLTQRSSFSVSTAAPGTTSSMAQHRILSTWKHIRRGAENVSRVGLGTSILQDGDSKVQEVQMGPNPSPRKRRRLEGGPGFSMDGADFRLVATVSTQPNHDSERHEHGDGDKIENENKGEGDIMGGDVGGNEEEWMPTSGQLGPVHMELVYRFTTEALICRLCEYVTSSSLFREIFPMQLLPFQHVVIDHASPSLNGIRLTDTVEPTAILSTQSTPSRTWSPPLKLSRVTVRMYMVQSFVTAWREWMRKEYERQERGWPRKMRLDVRRKQRGRLSCWTDDEYCTLLHFRSQCSANALLLLLFLACLTHMLSNFNASRRCHAFVFLNFWLSRFQYLPL